MIETDPYIGQVLDEKYRLERLLGRGSKARSEPSEGAEGSKH